MKNFAIIVFMRNCFRAIPFFVLLCNCTHPENNKKENTIGDIVSQDTVILDESRSYIANVLSAKYIRDSLLLIYPYGMDHIKVYANNGEFLYYLDADMIPDEKLPEKITNVSYSDELINIMYQGNYRIYQITSNKTIQNALSPNLNKKFTPESGIELFQYDTKDSLFIINTTYYGNQIDKFKHSEIIGVYSADGELIRTFGNYPDIYQEGKFKRFRMKFMQFDYDPNKNQVMAMSVIGPPTYKVYNLKGELLNEEQFAFAKFDPEVDIHGKELNDLILQAYRIDHVLYGAYQYFVDKTLEYEVDNFYNVFFRIDLRSGKIEEFPLKTSSYIHVLKSNQHNRFYYFSKDRNEEKSYLTELKTEELRSVSQHDVKNN